ncbi:MAG: glutaredoxin [Verrucomicrobia bacterium]|nr:MAG: glutaredoxin [Verrucomicrobiota bacterium]
MSQPSPKIVIYVKTFCGWSEGVRGVMRKYSLAYEEKDVVKNPAFRWEMEQRSGQALCPCVEVDGHMLVDVSGEEVEKWLVQNEYVRKDGQPALEPRHTLRADPPAKKTAPSKPSLPAKASKSRFFD